MLPIPPAVHYEVSRLRMFRIDAAFSPFDSAGENGRLVERNPVGFPVLDGGLVDVS